MAAMKKDIRDLVFLKSGNGRDGNVFKSDYMGYEFSLLMAQDSQRKCWHKDEPYIVDYTAMKLDHTVVKVFAADSGEYVGCAVLKDVIADATPAYLYYFPTQNQVKYTRAPLEWGKEYDFCLGNKEYSLAVKDGAVVVEAKKEKQSEEEPVVVLQRNNSRLGRVASFFGNTFSAASSSSSAESPKLR